MSGYDGGFNDTGFSDGEVSGGARRQLPGAWEWPILVYYQGYTYVNRARSNAPDETSGLIWFGPDVAYTTCFAPVLH